MGDLEDRCHFVVYVTFWTTVEVCDSRRDQSRYRRSAAVQAPVTAHRFGSSCGRQPNFDLSDICVAEFGIDLRKQIADRYVSVLGCVDDDQMACPASTVVELFESMDVDEFFSPAILISSHPSRNVKSCEALAGPVQVSRSRRPSFTRARSVSSPRVRFACLRIRLAS